jgi:hypothetical protein
VLGACSTTYYLVHLLGLEIALFVGSAEPAANLWHGPGSQAVTMLCCEFGACTHVTGCHCGGWMRFLYALLANLSLCCVCILCMHSCHRVLLWLIPRLLRFPESLQLPQGSQICPGQALGAS